MHIINQTDEQWMALALTQAAQAMASGEVPVGAVAVLDGRVIAEGHNIKEAEQDPTAHAELVVLRHAARILENWRLGGVTLYSTLEPCPMCAGAMIQARLERLVYGAKDIRFGADLPRQFSFHFGVENLGDKLYAEHINSLNPFTRERIPELGRNFYAGLTKTW